MEEKQKVTSSEEDRKRRETRRRRIARRFRLWTVPVTVTVYWVGRTVREFLFRM
ncbi:hypothetical protein [Streptomyces sp. NPDC047014]|uniref:hypothetical protein n=1 Tax=Streptomyces sp. NPDC047014 TaxID=3155736 RepID=UPI0033DCDF6C